MLLRRPARLHRPPVRVGGAGSRPARRRSWLGRALAATAACQLIFADPDNGIRPAGHREPSHRAKAVKHAYLDELAAFAQRGQSLVVYHHADRSATVDQQARRGLTDLTRGVPVQPVAAVRACRGSNRLFLIGAASAAHSRYLTGRLTAFQHGPWVGELTVYWPG
jgi:hypothetical protein